MPETTNTQDRRARIRRCLFVGLGGTGMRSLLNAKKLLVETYGMVPPMVGFLGVDTDRDAYSKTLESRKGLIKLEPSDQQSIGMQRGQATRLYQANVEHFSWIPAENIDALEDLSDLGAGQIRSNGRFAFIANYQQVAAKVRSKINSITQAQISYDDNFELMGNGAVEIHVAFSVCGGTGCGTFLDMAYLLRREVPNAKIIGYAVLPDVFDAMVRNRAEKAYIYPNAFGALQDLDYTMHMSRTGNQKFNLDYVNQQFDAVGRPFDSCYIIDNKNSNGDAYLQANQLSEMISLAMVTSAGALSGALASVSDNLEKVIRDGYMNIMNKTAWVGGLGVCEILFRGKELREAYAIKVMRHLASRLLSDKGDAATLVNNWIDSPEVKIRENGGPANDDVIDFILPKRPKVQMMDVNNKQNAEPEVNSYLQSASVQPKAMDIDAKVSELSTRVYAELEKIVNKTLNGESGVGLARAIIDGITKQVDIFLGEMNEELETLQGELPRQAAAITTTANMLRDASSGFMSIFRTREIETLTQELVVKANKNAECRRDIIRHQAAVTFFTGLKAQLIEQGQKVDNIKELLNKVAGECDARIAQISNAGSTIQTFQIDLSEELLRSVTYDESQIIMSDFVRSLGTSSVADFNRLSSGEVYALLFNYANNLPSAQAKEATTIDAVINEMSTAEFRSLIDKAIKKSSPLLTEDNLGMGMSREAPPSDSFYIGVNDERASRFVNGGKNEPEGSKVRFENLLSRGEGVFFASTGSTERVIIFRQFGVIPCYAVQGLLGFDTVYSARPDRFHLDANLLRRMRGEDYGLRPTQAVDDSLELWIKGFIFGLIKWNDAMKTYEYINKKEGNILYDFWMPLAQYRNDAFTEFKKHLLVAREEFNAYIKQQRIEQGMAFVDSEIAHAKDNYYVPATGEGVGMIRMDINELNARGNEPILSLVKQEVECLQTIN